jgi:hypothetical protein
MKHNDISDISTTLKKNNYANLFNVYTDTDNDNIYHYNINKSLNFKGLNEDPDNDFINNIFDYYNIRADDTWQIISFRQYGTVELWWLVCKANSIYNPLEIPALGTAIRLLKPTLVDGILNDIKAG